jgi:protoporphyrinogen oxidase
MSIDKEKKDNIVILGAGPAGLCTGFNLVEKANVTILEKESYTGGLCHTFKKDDFAMDFGPHIIHTTKKDIIYFMKKILGEDIIQRTAKAQIYFNKKFVEYPIRGMKVLKILGPVKMVFACCGYLKARILLFLHCPKNDASFRDWIINRFGKTLYDIYFGPYAQKAWKIKDTEISAYIAKKRVPVVTLTDYIRSIINLKPKSFHPEDPASVDIYYPKYGVGQIPDFLKNSIIEKKGLIINNITVQQLTLFDNKFQFVRFIENGVEKEIPVDFLFSTVPINELISLITPAPPKNVLDAARNIDYCAEKILYIKVNKESVFEAPLVYFQDPNVRFNRIYGFKKHGPYCIPEGKEALCVEFTCSVGDEIWNASDEELYSEVLNVLEKIGVLNHKEVDSYFTKKVTHAYPRFRVNFEKNLEIIFKYLETIENGVTLGRQGLFCYANLDEVLHMGFKSVEFYNSIKYTGIDYQTVFKKYIHIEE